MYYRLEWKIAGAVSRNISRIQGVAELYHRVYPSVGALGINLGTVQVGSTVDAQRIIPYLTKNFNIKVINRLAKFSHLFHDTLRLAELQTLVTHTFDISTITMPALAPFRTVLRAQVVKTLPIKVPAPRMYHPALTSPINPMKKHRQFTHNQTSITTAQPPHTTLTTGRVKKRRRLSPLSAQLKGDRRPHTTT